MLGRPHCSERSGRPEEAKAELAEAERLVRELPYPDWGQQRIGRATLWTAASLLALWWSGWLNPWWALLVFPCALYVQFRRKACSIESRARPGVRRPTRRCS